MEAVPTPPPTQQSDDGRRRRNFLKFRVEIHPKYLQLGTVFEKSIVIKSAPILMKFGVYDLETYI